MKAISLTIVFICTFASTVHFSALNSTNIKELGIEEELKQPFNWQGHWDWETNSGQLSFVVRIEPLGKSNGYRGLHCMVDGRIHGGAGDCSFDDSDFTLTNSRQVNGHVLEFDFRSGYTGSPGKARIIKVSENQIRFIMVEEPFRFELSPLGNYLWLNDGIGSDATGGIVLTRRPD